MSRSIFLATARKKLVKKGKKGKKGFMLVSNEEPWSRLLPWGSENPTYLTR